MILNNLSHLKCILRQKYIIFSRRVFYGKKVILENEAFLQWDDGCWYLKFDAYDKFSMDEIEELKKQLK